MRRTKKGDDADSLYEFGKAKSENNDFLRGRFFRQWRFWGEERWRASENSTPAAPTPSPRLNSVEAGRNRREDTREASLTAHTRHAMDTT